MPSRPAPTGRARAQPAPGQIVSMAPALETDVMVVGAGPVGLVLANLLGSHGVRVELIERRETTGLEPRAVLMDDESLRCVQAVGLHEPILANTLSGYGAGYYSQAGGRCFARVEAGPERLGFPARNRFHQPDLEVVLRQGLDRFPSVTSRFSTELLSFSQDDTGVTARLGSGSGERQVRARYLVGCDGAASRVRDALSLRLEGETFVQRWLILDLLNVRQPALDHTAFICDPHRPAVIVPGPNGRRRFEFMLRPGESPEAMLAGDCAALLEAHGQPRPHQVERKTVYAFHARIANAWRVNRVFLAGDAAHLMPPFAGQGMNTGIRDAANLAWKLAVAVREPGAASLLDSYERERKPHAAELLQFSLMLGRVVMTPNRLRAALRDLGFGVADALPWARRFIRRQNFKPQPRHRVGFFLRGEPHAPPSLVGAMAPQPWVRCADGARRRLDALLGPGFALVGIDVSLPPEAIVRLSPGLRALGLTRVRLCTSPTSTSPEPDDATVGVLDPQDPASAELLAHAGALMLVRPDRYVAGCIRPSQILWLFDELETLLGRTRTASDQSRAA
jgi:3-(3-hydroxy-phenyl)propionate hydroxylase